jgi:hypothetical protein
MTKSPLATVVDDVGTTLKEVHGTIEVIEARDCIALAFHPRADFRLVLLRMESLGWVGCIQRCQCFSNSQYGS